MEEDDQGGRERVEVLARERAAADGDNGTVERGEGAVVARICLKALALRAVHVASAHARLPGF